MEHRTVTKLRIALILLTAVPLVVFGVGFGIGVQRDILPLEVISAFGIGSNVRPFLKAIGLIPDGRS